MKLKFLFILPIIIFCCFSGSLHSSYKNHFGTGLVKFILPKGMEFTQVLIFFGDEETKEFDDPNEPLEMSIDQFTPNDPVVIDIYDLDGHIHSFTFTMPNSLNTCTGCEAGVDNFGGDLEYVDGDLHINLTEFSW